LYDVNSIRGKIPENAIGVPIEKLKDGSVAISVNDKHINLSDPNALIIGLCAQKNIKPTD
jgi:hypothetical protein